MGKVLVDTYPLISTLLFAAGIVDPHGVDTDCFFEIIPAIEFGSAFVFGHEISSFDSWRRHTGFAGLCPIFSGVTLLSSHCMRFPEFGADLNREKKEFYKSCLPIPYFVLTRSSF